MMAQEEEISNPYTIFPEEIWEMIFGKLNQFEDSWNVRKVHSFWEELLNKKRQVWMFEKMFPNIFPYLDIPSVFKCRLVNRRWNGGVINYLNNNHPALWPVTIPPVSLNPETFRLFDGLVIDQDNIDDLHTDLDLRDHFRAHPYPSRHITIEWQDDEDDVSSDEEDDEDLDRHRNLQRITEYWDKCYDLLDDFQAHIHHLLITMEGGLSTEMTDAMFYIILQKCLCRLPNLRSVVISGSLGLFCNPSKLAEVRQSHPLPELPYLGQFSIEIADLPVKFELEIYNAYGRQLKQIELMDYLLKSRFTPNPVVHFIRLHLHQNNHRPISGHQIHRILSRLTFPNVEKLTLETRELQAATIHEVLQSCPRLSWLAIECWEPIYSCISLPENDSHDIWKKHLELKLLRIKNTFLKSWDFLGCTPALQYIIVWGLDPLKSLLLPFQPEQDVSHITLENQVPVLKQMVRYSKLWAILPSLEQLLYLWEEEEETFHLRFFRPSEQSISTVCLSTELQMN